METELTQEEQQNVVNRIIAEDRLREINKL